MNYKNRVGIQVVASRAECLPLLLESLRVQTFKRWDLILVLQDEGIIKDYYVQALLQRLQFEGHRVKVIRGKDHYGLCRLRNIALKNDDCEYGLRIDDDSICEPDYIERLFRVMTKENGVVGGIVPFIHEKRWNPWKKEDRIKAGLTPTLNMVDDKFNIYDDCVFFYNTDDEYAEVDHIRSSFMYKNSVAKKIKFPTYNDDLAAFREETDFCLRMKWAGHKILFVPKAVCWHLLAPHSGTRPTWMRIGEEGSKKADKRFRERMNAYKIQKHNRKGRGNKTKKV